MEGHGLCALIALGSIAVASWFFDLWRQEKRLRERYGKVMAAAGRNLEEAEKIGSPFPPQGVAKRTRIYLESELADGT